MTRFYLIRHGEPDWALADGLGLIGRDREFVTLTEEGVREIVEASRDPRFRNAELVISSPYPRCLHSAHILSRVLDLPLVPERDIHEWYGFRNPAKPRHHEETGRMWGEILTMEGRYPPPEEREWDWESPDEIRARALPVLQKYKNRRCVIAVSHAGVIYALTGATDVYHGNIVEFDLDEDEGMKKGSEA
jgi:broad specificity phosphatase PhoE